MFCTEGETEEGKRGEGETEEGKRGQGGIAGRERWKIGRDGGERGTIGSVVSLHINVKRKGHTHVRLLGLRELKKHQQ